MISGFPSDSALQAATSAQSPVGSEAVALLESGHLTAGQNHFWLGPKAQKTQTPQKPETSAVDKTREEASHWRLCSDGSCWVRPSGLLVFSATVQVEQAVEFVKAAVQRPAHPKSHGNSTSCCQQAWWVHGLLPLFLLQELGLIWIEGRVLSKTL